MPRPSEHPPADRPLPPTEADGIAEFMHAFGTPSRVQLLYTLLRGDATVEALADMTGLSPTVASQQLRVLRLQSLVSSRRHGRHVHYSLADEHVTALLRAVRAHADHRLGRSTAEATS